MKDKLILKISHPDPKEEKRMAKVIENFAKQIGKIAGEDVSMIKIEDPEKAN